MSAGAFMRMKKLTGKNIITTAARHNRREIRADMGTNGSIDPALSHLNQSLKGPENAEVVGALAKTLMLQAGVTKHRADAVMGLEFVFSLPVNHALNEVAYFGDCSQWVGARYGGEQNILSVDIHRDEAAPHCHVLLVPLLNGRLQGSDMMGNKAKLVAAQQQFFEAVAKCHGLDKPPGRMSSASKQDGAARVLARLKSTSDAALSSALWPTIREAIERDPLPHMLTLGIDATTVSKPLKTMTQVFTSRGKGPAKDVNLIGFEKTSKHVNPIGFDASQKEQTLCSVGFGQKSPPSVPTEKPMQRQKRACDVDPVKLVDQLDHLKPWADCSLNDEAGWPGTTREREGQVKAARWCEELGEFLPDTALTSRNSRAAADAWTRQQVKQTSQARRATSR